MPKKNQFPTFKQLQCLATIDDERHFRLAADALGVSQPSLSMQFNALETTLGVVLADRGRSGVRLTPIGREIADRARRVLVGVQEICDLAAASGTDDGLVGTLRLGTSSTLGPYVLPQVVKRLHREYPNLKLYIREGTPRELQSDLIYGRYDLVLSPMPLASDDLTVTRLFLEPLYLVVASDHELSAKSEVDSSDLSGLKVLAPASHYLLHDQVKSICDEVGAELLRDYEGTSLDTLRQMVGMGLGVSFLPSLYVQSEIRARGEVKAIPFKGRKISRTIGIAWRKSSGATQSLAAITSIFREVARMQFSDLRMI